MRRVLNRTTLTSIFRGFPPKSRSFKVHYKIKLYITLTKIYNILLLFCCIGITAIYYIVVSDGLHIWFVVLMDFKHKRGVLNQDYHSQSGSLRQPLHKTLKSKVLKCCANICSNRQCLKQNLTPNYTKTEIPNTSPAATCTKHKQ